MKTYRGVRSRLGCGVTVEGDGISTAGRIRELPIRLDLANHSPTGFEWGYGGSGPAQLALAILADAIGEEAALECYQDFKDQVIARFEANWEIDSRDIEAWHVHRWRGKRGEGTE